jgi:hypothetical protein
MSSKSRKRQTMVANLYRAFDDPNELFREIMRLADAWCKERGLTLFTKEDAVALAGCFLKNRGIIKLPGGEWAVQVIEQTNTNAGPRIWYVTAYRDLLIKLVDAGQFTHKQVVDKIMQTYPALNRKSVQTYLSDCKSWKFTHLGHIGLIVTDAPTGILYFDRASTRPADVPPYRNPRRRSRSRSSEGYTQPASNSNTNRSVASAAGGVSSIPSSNGQQFVVTVVPVEV